jgi:hypothetical protein
MKDRDFEELIETWASHETASAPDLRPTDDMYQMVRAKAKKKPWFLARPRWALASAALASLVVLAIVYTAFFHSPAGPDSPPTQQIAMLGLRPGFASEKGPIVTETAEPEGKGPTRGALPFRQLVFQFQKQDSPTIQTIDLQTQPQAPPDLTPADNYRLLLEPAEDRHVYVFQLTVSNDLIQLFPNPAYSAAQNPLRAGQTYYLPPPPNGFYLNAQPGQQRLYLVASAQPLPELAELYSQYAQADEPSDRAERLASLLDTLKRLSPETTDRWEFVFDHR